MNSDSSRRIYLYVPYEDRAEVRALGARWDVTCKCWYIDAAANPAPFRRWLGTDESDGYAIRSSHAYVASARSVCERCRAHIEVVCIYCRSGEIDGELHTRFSVYNITAVDAALRKQLAWWPQFFCGSGDAQDRWVNHCSACHAAQAEHLMHCEPDGPFFSLTGPGQSLIQYAALTGLVRLSGDEGWAL